MAITDITTVKLSDNVYTARSKWLVDRSDGTYGLIRLPKNSFVSDVWFLVATVFSGGTPTVTIGWIGNGETAQASGFMSDEISKCTELGLKRSYRDNLLSYGGKYFYTSSGMITLTIAGTPTAGKALVLVNYAIIS